MSDPFLIECPNITLLYDSSFFPSAIRKPVRPFIPLHSRLFASPWVDSVFILAEAVFDRFVGLIPLSSAPNEAEKLIPIYRLAVVVDATVTDPGQRFCYVHHVNKAVRWNADQIPSFLILHYGLN